MGPSLRDEISRSPPNGSTLRDTTISNNPKTPAKRVVDEAVEVDGDFIAVEEDAVAVTEVDTVVDTEVDVVAGVAVAIIRTTKRTNV